MRESSGELVKLDPARIFYLSASYPDLVDEYAELVTDPPPIVIDRDWNVIDGAHRVKARSRRLCSRRLVLELS